MLTTCDTGDGDMGILGMKRERSVTEDSLIASSSINKFDGNSCTKKGSKKGVSLPCQELNQMETQKMLKKHTPSSEGDSFGRVYP